MRILLRILIWSAVAVVLLFVAAAVALYVLYPKERIIEELVPRVEEAVDRPVALADAGLSLWPPFGMYVEGLVIENREPAHLPHLLRVGRARAHVRLWPLLQGEVYVDEIEIHDAEFTYETFDDTLTNISDLTGGEQGGVPLLAEHMAWSAIHLSGMDHRDSSSWQIQDLGGEITVRPEDSTFEARISLPHAEWLRPGDSLRFDHALELSAAGTVDLNAQLVHLASLEGALAGVPLSGVLDASLAAAVPSLHGALTLGPAALPDILTEFALLPDSLLREYTLAGQVRLEITLDGPLDELHTGGATAQLVWLGGRVTRAGEDLVEFASLTVPATGEGFHVSAQDLLLFGSPVEMGLVGSWPPDDRVELTLASQTHLEPWTSDSITLAGVVEWSASARGPLRAPERWRVRAHATPREVRYAYGDRGPLSIDGGRVTYDGQSLELTDFQLVSVSSRLQMSTRIQPLVWSDLATGSLPDSTFADVDLSASRLDLDALFPELAGDSAAPADTSTPPVIPATYAQIALTADTLVAGGTTWREVVSEARVDPDSLHVERLQGRVYGGRAALSGVVELADQAGYRFHVRVDSVAMGDLLTRFGRAGRHLDGKGSLDARVAGRGFTWEALLSDLLVDGGAILFDARLVNLPAARAMQELLGLEITDPLPLVSRWSAFRVDAGRLAMDDFQFTTSGAQWTLVGTAGLDATLDYTLGGLLSRAQSDRVRLPADVQNLFPAAWRERIDPVELLKNDDGQLELFLHVGGTLQKPAVSLDWQRLEPLLKQRLQQRVTDQLKQELVDELEKGLEGLFDKLKR